VDTIEERHRHRYKVNPKYIKELKKASMKVVGHDTENVRMEVMELDNHPYYVAVQYHPEYISRNLAPSPPYFGLILASVGKLSSFLSHGCQSTTPSHELSEPEDSDEEISSMARNLSYSDTVESVSHSQMLAKAGADLQPQVTRPPAGPKGDTGGK